MITLFSIASTGLLIIYPYWILKQNLREQAKNDPKLIIYPYWILNKIRTTAHDAVSNL